jgi:hypothetical protein
MQDSEFRNAKHFPTEHFHYFWLNYAPINGSQKKFSTKTMEAESKQSKEVKNQDT